MASAWNHGLPRKLFGVFLAAVVLLAFTAEFGHSIEEVVAHRGGHDSEEERDPSPHRCHNCVTSQPQGPISTWEFNPRAAVVFDTVFLPAPILKCRPLFEVPQDRAPPVA
jgi:hypothetical protein